MTDQIIQRLQALLEEMQRTNIRSYPLKAVVLEQWRQSLRAILEDARKAAAAAAQPKEAAKVDK